MEGIGNRQGGISPQALERMRMAHFYARFAGCGCRLLAMASQRVRQGCGAMRQMALGDEKPEANGENLRGPHPACAVPRARLPALGATKRLARGCPPAAGGNPARRHADLQVCSSTSAAKVECWRLRSAQLARPRVCQSSRAAIAAAFSVGNLARSFACLEKYPENCGCAAANFAS